MKYYSAERNEILLWYVLQHGFEPCKIMLKKPDARNKYHMIPFIWGTQNREFIERKVEYRLVELGGAGREEVGITV